mmetsp:Transcript_42468/g.79516  ORF Transcript_42468/g.79516 Transcript_42468/m.79516 type:complete len:103 (-) Transcript_42468:1820-2128(-)
MLTNMGLYQNRLTGTMPSILATLTSLITLDLSINELSGTIPKEWATLTNLRYMSLYHNQLVGTVPNELAKLSKLSFMYGRWWDSCKLCPKLCVKTHRILCYF